VQPKPSVTIERMVEWPDTDAAGHYHHSTVIRWVEAAEAALHSQLGLDGLFGSVPRVRYEVDYLARLWFRDVVQISLEIADVGRTSLAYEFTVRRDGEAAARGRMVCVNVGPKGAGATVWPDDVRTRLLS
jgi:acyl-CoA thioesterase FadM